MAPPLVKGRALARRRVAGILFLVVLGLLAQTSIWLYEKKFTPVVNVALQTDRAGNQLSVHADVKVRGIVVGEVHSIRSSGDGAVLQLALDPAKAKTVPSDARAELLPKTLFGEKEVVLVVPEGSTARPLRSGDVIPQDHSATALETETALNDLLPLLKSLQPQKLSEVMVALSTALRHRGEKLGGNMSVTASYLHRLNPSLPLAGADFKGLADLANNIEVSSPDLLKELDNLAFSSRSLVQDRAALDAFLSTTSRFANTTRQLVAQNEARLDALSKDSVKVLQLFAHYSNTYPCLLNRIAFAETEGERVFGGKQPGLHITIEYTRDHGGYAAGDEPKYKDTPDFGCFGLGRHPIIPFPAYRNPQDGYRDSDPPEDPGKGPNGCCTSDAAWVPDVVEQPSATVVHDTPMPRGTTTLDALLVGPLVS